MKMSNKKLMNIFQLQMYTATSSYTLVTDIHVIKPEKLLYILYSITHYDSRTILVLLACIFEAHIQLTAAIIHLLPALIVTEPSPWRGHFRRNKVRVWHGKLVGQSETLVVRSILWENRIHYIGTRTNDNI